MAGTNLIIARGQMLFKQGEPSDGMYIIRKGEIAVFIEKGGTDVRLATVTSGAMIGEMALFDQKPRSASAKAIQDTEVTKISNQDFKKIMKQIPKWFVGLMSTLSTRLRETNDKLHTMQSHLSGMGRPFENTLRTLYITALLWHKDGAKEQKNWVIARKPVENEIHDILGIHPSIIKSIIGALAEGGLIKLTKNSYGVEQMAIANRGHLDKFTSFLFQFTKDFPDKRDIPVCLTDLLKSLKGLVARSGYDTVTISFEDAEMEGAREGYSTRDWKKALAFFDRQDDAISLVKTSSGSTGFKVSKKSFPKAMENYNILVLLVKVGVS